jgi:hypothetical protein
MYGGAHPLKSRIDGGRSLFALQRDPEWKWLQQGETYLQGCYRDFAAQLPLERNTLHVTSRMGLAGRLV